MPINLTMLVSSRCAVLLLTDRLAIQFRKGLDILYTIIKLTQETSGSSIFLLNIVANWAFSKDYTVIKRDDALVRVLYIKTPPLIA